MAEPPAVRDRYPDALRAGALLVVVLGHWLATLPRTEGGRVVATDHLLTVWDGAALLTWVLQVVPLFVFVSAAVSADGVAERRRRGDGHRVWWARRALGLARPTVTYLGVLAVMAVVAWFTGGRLLGPLDHSLTVHLWFLLMLLAVQALLPLGVWADERLGLRAVAGLLVVAVVVDLVRGQVTSPAELTELGARVTGTGGGVGWLNGLVVWLVPQQLGIAWRRRRFGGPATGVVLLAAGLAWLVTSVAVGYPVAVVGGELDGSSNVLPPTVALLGVMWLQVGAVLAVEPAARRLLARRPVGRAVTILGALGMPLYLWHKLAELPAAWVGEQLGVALDVGVPGEAGFWSGRAVWIALCLLCVAPVMGAVVAFETRRAPSVPPTTSTAATLLGGGALFAAIAVAMALGAQPGAIVGVVLVGAASWLLRDHRRSDAPRRHRRRAPANVARSVR